MRTTSKKIRIALAGGGTGGHVYPLIAVAEELHEQAIGSSNLEFHYYGARDGFTADIEKAGIITHAILAGKLRRYFSPLNILDAVKVFLSFFQAFWKLYWLMPDAVFSKGGPGSVPIVFAAWFYRIPVVIHESDAIPGLANLLSARFARRIAVGHESAAKYFNPNKVVLTGNPVRSSVLKWKLEQGIAKEKLGFTADKPLILVMGGSQGAQSLNELIVISLSAILPISQILHQTGPNNFTEVDKLSKAAIMEIPVEVEKQSRYKCLAYLDEETGGAALSAADLVVGRAGAGSITEFAAFSKPAILIPLAGHQTENAYAFAAVGAAQVIEEGNLTEQVFTSLVGGILGHPEILQRMALASEKYYRPQASLDLAREILASAGYQIA